ncbi:MAG: MFS transporter [Pseudomonadota bacterium]
MSDARLDKKTLAAYSGISMPIAAMIMPVAVYLPPFYSAGLGINLATVGLIFTLARVWDVITDPIMGVLIDRFDTRWGRRKHWIALGVPVMMLAIWMVFIPDPEQVSPLYLGFWLVVMYLGYTMMAIAHQSWGAELAVSYDDRSRLFTWREVFLLSGMTIVLATPALVEYLGVGDQATKIASMGILCIILLPVTAIPILLWVPDRAARTTMTVNWVEAVKIMVTNTILWRLLIADLATGFATSSTGALYIFLISYVFELPQMASIMLLLVFLLGTLGMPVWLKVATRWGKDKTIRMALGFSMAMHGLLFFMAGPGNVAGIWVYTVLYGFVFGVAPTLLRSMMADVTDLDEVETGTKRAGLFYAVMTTSSKLGSALAVGITFAFVQYVFGFEAKPDNTQTALDGLLFTYCAFGTLSYLLAYVAFIRYPLTKQRHEAIAATLADRYAEDQAAATGGAAS